MITQITAKTAKIVTPVKLLVPLEEINCIIQNPNASKANITAPIPAIVNNIFKLKTS